MTFELRPNDEEEMAVQRGRGSSLSSSTAGAKPLRLLQNQIWVCSPTHSKANLLTLGCGEGRCSIYCRVSSKEYRLNSLMAFREVFLKTE